MKALILASLIVLSGCTSIAERAAFPYATPLGQAADVGTTAYALWIANGFAEANPFLQGLNGGSAIAALMLLAKPIFPVFLPDLLDQADCKTATTAWGLFGWGAAGWNTAVLAGAATSAGLAVGAGTVILLWPWLNASAELACE